ncbi:leucine rich adaptor protein 1 [Alosa pseudoharengus]|uniref:leucine rich adaptor protein 1 n=1 Tax=Alosa pseudoharengus TaxID=34774 RepID=UPI003F8CA658
MDEGNANDSVPDLKDLEVKIGRKTPEGLLKWMREESAHRGESKSSIPECIDRDPARKSLDDKIRKLKVEMAHLRSVDVRILQQLLAVHEGIEAVKWLLEERSTLTSRCSSLTSSQYSLADGPEVPSPWRGSWGSLHDPHDRLDNISIGSYLDTLADDMDEYGCPSSSESVLCSTPLGGSTAEKPAARTGGGDGGAGAGLSSGSGSPVVKQPEAPKEDVWTRNPDAGRAASSSAKPPPALDRTLSPKANGMCESARACLAEKLGKSQSPKAKPYQNGRVELDTCKLNGRVHLEYDAHWRWVQSQDDVTFL